MAEAQNSRLPSTLRQIQEAQASHRQRLLPGNQPLFLLCLGLQMRLGQLGQPHRWLGSGPSVVVLLLLSLLSPLLVLLLHGVVPANRVDQHLDNPRVAKLDGVVQREPSLYRGHLDVGAGIQQRADGAGPPTPRRPMERCKRVAVGQRRVGAQHEKHRNQIGPLGIHHARQARKVERTPPVAPLSQVQIRLLPLQRAGCIRLGRDVDRVHQVPGEDLAVGLDLDAGQCSVQLVLVPRDRVGARLFRARPCVVLDEQAQHADLVVLDCRVERRLFVSVHSSGVSAPGQDMGGNGGLRVVAGQMERRPHRGGRVDGAHVGALGEQQRDQIDRPVALDRLQQRRRRVPHPVARVRDVDKGTDAPLGPHSLDLVNHVGQPVHVLDPDQARAEPEQLVPQGNHVALAPIVAPPGRRPRAKHKVAPVGQDQVKVVPLHPGVQNGNPVGNGEGAADRGPDHNGRGPRGGHNGLDAGHADAGVLGEKDLFQVGILSVVHQAQDVVVGEKLGPCER